MIQAANFDEVMERIAAKLEQHGFSERDASLQATGKPDMLRDMRRRRGLPNSQRLARLAQLLGTSSDWLLHGGVEHFTPPADLVRTEVRGTGMGAKDVEAAWINPAPHKPVPLLGSAMGGDWDDIEDVEMTELHLSEVLDYLGRPPSLGGDQAAYAVEIVGDSMAPRFEPGERVYVSPRAAVGIGNDVIVQLQATSGTEGSQINERVTMVLIKRLVRRTAKFVELRQFNPDKCFTVPIARVKDIHRVMGRI